jgi:DNA-binding beta-propeller fold protein YncE
MAAPEGTMTRRGLRRALAAMTLLAVGAGAAATATADGLPVVNVDAGPTGVATGDGSGRYVTVPAGEDTVVARTEQAGGRIQGSALLRGGFTIPAVAYDGSSGGLSADGGTLVLIAPRMTFPRVRTALAVLDARRLRLRTKVFLRGDFSFDAVSPDGGRIYLIQYIAPQDPNRYRVRAFDLRSHRLLARPIVDPTEPGEAMRGAPVTRAVSPDGRWAYTLYDGGGTPFVHALDTAAAAARCVDLDLLGRRDVSAARLSVSSDGARVSVIDGDGPAAVIDAATFRVSAPPALFWK